MAKPGMKRELSINSINLRMKGIVLQGDILCYFYNYSYTFQTYGKIDLFTGSSKGTDLKLRP